MSERGQISVAAVGVIALLALGGVLMGYMSMISVGGGYAQRAADLAAIAAAQRLGAAPDAPPGELRAVAAEVARRNGGRLLSMRVVRTGSVPRAVDVAVALGVRGSVPVAGQERRSVVARARAGVAFSASLAAGAFRPVDLHGVRGPLAAVAAAEAQVGWPYVWGGESRAEGGFDCSGLVDYAYAVAGFPLPGRPTAADLWRVARPEAAAELAPADLVFVGAASGAPHHVGMYVGGGMVVVAPHTGARVRYEPLAAGGWDGFGRLLAAGPIGGERDAALEAAARAHQVPTHVLAAELRLGLATDPDAAATALAAAMRRHPSDLAAALADALGDPSAAALVLRSASGSALPEFSAAVRLLPVPAAAVAAPVPATSASRRAGRSGPGIVAAIDIAGQGVKRGAVQIDHLGRRLSVQAAAGLGNLLRFGITGAAAFLPNPHLQDVATLAGAVWDGVETTIAIARGGVELEGASLWATRLTTPFGVVFTGVFAWQAWSARRRSDQIWYGAQAASSALAAVGAFTAGTDLIALGAGTAEVPPLGAGLMLLGVLVLAGACVYREWDWLGGRLHDGAAAAGRVLRGAAGATRRELGWARAKAGHAAGAALDAGRSLAGSLNPFG